MVDVLEAAAAAVLHADPELVTTEVGTVVSDDVGVAAILQGGRNNITLNIGYSDTVTVTLL